jgi:hypothetical protein
MAVHRFFGAFMAYQRATVGRVSLPALLEDAEMQADPLSSCGVCASLPADEGALLDSALRCAALAA